MSKNWQDVITDCIIRIDILKCLSSKSVFFSENVSHISEILIISKDLKVLGIYQILLMKFWNIYAILI